LNDTIALAPYECIDEPKTKLILELISRLDSIEDLREELIQVEERLHRELALDRQRLAKLEKPRVGFKRNLQLDKAESYLRECRDYTASFESVRYHLGLSKTNFSTLIHSDEASDRFVITSSRMDGRRKLLQLRPKI